MRKLIVTKYVTDDGKEFDSPTEAKAHEVELDSLAQLASLLKESIATGRSEAILRQILVESDGLRRILCDYGRRLPRKEAA